MAWPVCIEFNKQYHLINYRTIPQACLNNLKQHIFFDYVTTLSPIASCTNIASLEMWKIILASLASLSKKLISFFSTACKYFKRKRAVCLSPVCIQNATPEKIVVNSDHVMGVVIWVITSLVYPSLSPFLVNVRKTSNYSHWISNKNIT